MNNYDTAISIAFDVGALAPSQSQTFTHYTSVDNRDLSTDLSMMICRKTICT